MDAIFYFFMREIFVNWSEKVHIYWLANSARLDTGLNAVEGQPFGVVGSAAELVDEFGVFHDTHMLIVVFEGCGRRVWL